MRNRVEKCLLCGSANRSVLYEKTRSGRIVECRQCGLVYADPRSGVQPDFFKKDILTDKVQEGDWTRRNVLNRLELIKAKAGHSAGKLLDVGCYAGFGLQAAQAVGWEAIGLEPDPAASEWGRKELGVEIHTSTLEEATFPENSFDLITYHHSWEHLDDPVGSLNRSLGWLKPNGVIYLETPDYDNRWRKLLGPGWRQFIHDHYLFLTPQTALKLFDQLKIDPVFIGNVEKSFSLGLFLDRIERYYWRGLGRSLSMLAKMMRADKITLQLNPGDILVALGRKQDYNT